MNKNSLILVFITLIFSIFIFFENATKANLVDENFNQIRFAIETLNPEEIHAFQFLQTRMQSPHGLIYYLVENESSAAYSVLESMGQAMEYAALIGDEKLFNKYAKITDKYFKAPTGFYYWKIDVSTKTGEPASALVDDLRIVKAYFLAIEKKLGNYDKQLTALSEMIFRFDIDANGYPSDYYDGKAQQKANTVSLFYLDVETFGKLTKINNRWSTPYKNAKDILLNMPDNKCGFYPKTFQTKSKRYVWGPAINMVENLYTAIDAVHAGKNTRPLVNFLKNQVRAGKIYNHYNLDGTPANQDESTAVYALAARFLVLNNEYEAAEWCYHRTLQFQISDQNSFAGGFGDQESGTVYAFNQLEALLMLRMVKPK